VRSKRVMGGVGWRIKYNWGFIPGKITGQKSKRQKVVGKEKVAKVQDVVR